MIEYFYVACLLTVVVPLAVFFLSWRDRKRWTKKDNARPIAERIKEISELAASQIADLPRLRRRIMMNHPDREEAWAWIDPVVDYYRRLESLASSQDATAQDAVDLANEAGEFLRQRKVKGVAVAGAADKLAKLIEECDSACGSLKA